MRISFIIILFVVVGFFISKCEDLIKEQDRLSKIIESRKPCMSTNEILRLNAIYERYVNEGKQDSAFKYYKLMQQ